MRKEPDNEDRDQERQPLLSDIEEDPNDAEAKKERERREKLAARLIKEGNWFTYAKSFSIFIPLVFPVGNRKLQARCVGVAFCLIIRSILSVLIPFQFGLMTGSLIDPSNSYQNPLFAVLFYGFLGFLSSGSVVDALQNRLWMPVQLNAYRKLSTASYNHVMNLSADFHDSKSSAEVFQALQQGKAVSDLFEVAAFRMLPMAIDLCVAFFYLNWLFGPYMVLVASAEVVVFLALTTKSIAMRTAIRRKYVNDMKKERTTGSEGLSSWQNAVVSKGTPNLR